MIQLLLATGNAHKVREFEELLGDEFEISDLQSLPGLQLPAETGATFEQNAALKAATVSRAVDKLVIADDSGLEVDALDGAPGIYSARYAGEKANDVENVAKLLHELKSLKITSDKLDRDYRSSFTSHRSERSARFRCVIAIARAGQVLTTFDGVVEGVIVDAPRGEKGFGYDPVFQPAGFNQTFAEMAAELKNRISHRAKAVTALREGLRKIAN